MAKKEDNFDFDTESEGKSKFDIVGFFKNLTKKQKCIIAGGAITIAVVVLAIIIVCIVGSITAKHPDRITDIYVHTKPNKTVYNIGEEVDYSGLIINVSKLSFRSEKVSYDEHPEDFKISGFDSSVAMENQVITVSYKGFTTTFKIDIKPDPNVAVHLVKIELSSLPKTEGKVLDFPSVKGGVILCTYSDGSTKEEKLTFAHTAGFEHVTAPGEYTIRVEYWDGDRCASTTYTINVTE